jgi:membrane protein YqaA with SNARE-associated domain
LPLAGQWIDAVGKQVAELGWAAPFVYVGLFAVGTVVLAPSPLMGIGGGIAFGWWGLPLTILGATAGATASFGISRYIFDVELEDWFKSRRIFQAAKRAIEDEGWKIQILLRLSPAVPFGLLNYLFGLTNTRLITYILSTAIGTLPGNFGHLCRRDRTGPRFRTTDRLRRGRRCNLGRRYSHYLESQSRPQRARRQSLAAAFLVQLPSGFARESAEQADTK